MLSESGRITVRRAIAAADACAAACAGGFHMSTVPDRDIKALPGAVTIVTFAAADARTIFAAGGGHGGVCTGDGDVSAISAAKVT